MDDSSNQPTAYEELGPVRPSTCGAEPRRNSPPSAEIQLLIADLGLRYQPSAQADLEAHAGQLAFLAVDLADIDPRDLDVAIRNHVRQSPFMPKACELIELADNARAEREFRERPIRPAIEYQREEIRPEPIIPCTAEQAAEIMREFGLKSNPCAPENPTGTIS